MDIYLVGKILGTAAYVVLEYWLGKTDKVKAASVLELVIDQGKKFYLKKEQPK